MERNGDEGNGDAAAGFLQPAVGSTDVGLRAAG
jgi:hypothetical protein